VDAFWLKVFQVTLGGEKRLFAEGTIPAAFKVTESTVSSKGVILVNYETCRRSPNRKCINLGRIAGMREAGNSEIPAAPKVWLGWGQPPLHASRWWNNNRELARFALGSSITVKGFYVYFQWHLARDAAKNAGSGG
jgi:hypothetical protein